MELLKKLYGIYSGSHKEEPMRKFLRHYLKRNVPGATLKEDKGNLYIVKGKSDTYPCLVAHMDQVQQKYPSDYVVVSSGLTLEAYDCQTRKRCGLGADDKNGIWIALKALEKYDTMKVVFFWGEECGMLGSRDADMSFFDDCRWVVQCDRKGHSDFINHTNGVEVCSSKFINDANLKSHKFSVQRGLATDIGVLKNKGLSICAANLSCGYYDAHTSEEYTVWPDLLKCQRLVEHMIEHMTDVYRHNPKPQPVAHDYSGYYSKGGWQPYLNYRQRTYSMEEVEEQIVQDMESYERGLYGDDWSEAEIRSHASRYLNKYGYCMKPGERITLQRVEEVIRELLREWQEDKMINNESQWQKNLQNG